jgi:Carboxypeptidase regulatory-like domain
MILENDTQPFLDCQGEAGGRRRYDRAMAVRYVLLAALVALGSSGCRTGVPVVDRGSKPPTQEGTIAGHVRTDGDVAVVSRLVRAVSVSTGQKFETSTNSAGSYTLKVPPGRYRLEVELRPGEQLSKQPGETQINPSDLDPARNFVIRASPSSS